MKRLTTILLSLLLLSLCFFGVAVNAGAAYDNFSVSADLKTLSVGDTEYYRFNGKAFDFHYMDIEADLKLPDDIVYYEIRIDSFSISYFITYKYADGTVMECYYLHEDYIEESNKLLSGKSDTVTVDFRWPKGNVAKLKPSQLKGEKTVLTSSDLMRSRDFSVVARSEDERLECILGILLVIEEKFYYYETTERFSTDIYNLDSVEVYTVQDAEALAELGAAMDAYNDDDDYAYLSDDSFMNRFSTVFLLLVFGAIPLAVLVLAVIRAFGRSSRYKKQYSALAIVSALMLTLVAVIASILVNAA